LRSTERNFLALLILAALAACGGGGGSSPSALPQSAPTSGSGATGTATAAPSSLPAGYARAAFSITIPASTSSAASRSRQAIGAGTQSITFTLLQSPGSTTAGTPQTFALTATAPGCSSNSAGITCTLSVSAPIGLDVFLAQTYTSTTGTGTLTGSGAVQLDVAQNSSNATSLTLSSQVASVFLTSTSAILGSIVSDDSSKRAPAARRKTAQASVASARIFVIALDSSGNFILNPSVYNSPYISLQLIYTDSGYGLGYPLASPTPDVNLQVAYSSIDAGCGSGTASTSASYGSIIVCSPADVITANLINVPGGAPGAVVIGSVGTSALLPSPAPSTTPAPLPTSTPANESFLAFSIGTLGGIDVYDENGYPVTSVTSLAVGTTTLPYNDLQVEEYNFSGSFTVGGNCGAIANLQTYNYNDGYAVINITTTAVGTCTATISDGTNTVSIPITVTTTTVTGS
jgi:hypothetical protein